MREGRPAHHRVLLGVVFVATLSGIWATKPTKSAGTQEPYSAHTPGALTWENAAMDANPVEFALREARYVCQDPLAASERQSTDLFPIRLVGCDMLAVVDPFSVEAERCCTKPLGKARIVYQSMEHNGLGEAGKLQLAAVGAVLRKIRRPDRALQSKYRAANHILFFRLENLISRVSANQPLRMLRPVFARLLRDTKVLVTRPSADLLLRDDQWEDEYFRLIDSLPPKRVSRTAWLPSAVMRLVEAEMGYEWGALVLRETERTRVSSKYDEADEETEEEEEKKEGGEGEEEEEGAEVGSFSSDTALDADDGQDVPVMPNASGRRTSTEPSTSPEAPSLTPLFVGGLLAAGVLAWVLKGGDTVSSWSPQPSSPPTPRESFSEPVLPPTAPKRHATGEVRPKARKTQQSASLKPPVPEKEPVGAEPEPRRRSISPPADRVQRVDRLAPVSPLAKEVKVAPTPPEDEADTPRSSHEDEPAQELRTDVAEGSNPGSPPSSIPQTGPSSPERLSPISHEGNRRDESDWGRSVVVTSEQEPAEPRWAYGEDASLRRRQHAPETGDRRRKSGQRGSYPGWMQDGPAEAVKRSNGYHRSNRDRFSSADGVQQKRRSGNTRRVRGHTATGTPELLEHVARSGHKVGHGRSWRDRLHNRRHPPRGNARHRRYGNMENGWSDEFSSQDETQFVERPRPSRGPLLDGVSRQPSQETESDPVSHGALASSSDTTEHELTAHPETSAVSEAGTSSAHVSEIMMQYEGAMLSSGGGDGALPASGAGELSPVASPPQPLSPGSLSMAPTHGPVMHAGPWVWYPPAMMVPWRIPVSWSPPSPQESSPVWSPPSPEPHHAATAETLRRQKLRQQVEYYFSNENLFRDFFLRRHMDEAGFVPLALLASFHRVRELSEDLGELCFALQESPFLEVVQSPGENSRVASRVRRREGWEAFVLQSPAGSV